MKERRRKEGKKEDKQTVDTKNERIQGRRRRSAARPERKLNAPVFLKEVHQQIFPMFSIVSN